MLQARWREEPLFSENMDSYLVMRQLLFTAERAGGTVDNVLGTMVNIGLVA